MKGRQFFQTQSNLWVWILMFILPRRKWYREHYLFSAHWKELRKKKLHTHNYCEKCTKPGIKKVNKTFNQLTLLDVHHLTYERIWHERLSDLQVLCRSCHKEEHT